MHEMMWNNLWRFYHIVTYCAFVYGFQTDLNMNII